MFNEDHPDDFTHRDPTQKIADQFYFHKSGKSYKSGTYKCMDITGSIENTYLGILVRSI
jgi:hypothetical protein